MSRVVSVRKSHTRTIGRQERHSSVGNKEIFLDSGGQVVSFTWNGSKAPNSSREGTEVLRTVLK